MLFRGSSSHSFRYILSTSIIVTILLLFHVQLFPTSRFVPYRSQESLADDYQIPTFEPKPEFEVHEIDKLIRDAHIKQQALLSKRTTSVEAAAKAYREKRGRHPPPGFEVWVTEALNQDAIIVEDFFDRIHHDLNPFWALNPADLRIQSNSYPQTIRIRDGIVRYDSDSKGRVSWVQTWRKLVSELAPNLPDLDIPINYMDETRVLVPWEQMNEYMQAEHTNRKIVPVNNVITSFPESGLKEMDKMRAPSINPVWVQNEAPWYWDHYRNSCPSDSPARNVQGVEDFSEPIDFPIGWPSYTYHGYIQNITRARDPCYQPHLRGMHGTFVESISMSTSHELIPLFGGSKLPMNNDILLPPAMYLSQEEKYNAEKYNLHPWISKKNQLIWRGVASGGRNRDYSWHRFQRHRFVQAMNSTIITQMEKTQRSSFSFQMPYEGLYDITAQKDHRLGEWVASWADAGFTDLECHPATKRGNRHRCDYTDDYFALKNDISVQNQFKYKFLPDIDGNSYSKRWRRLLLSTSVPIKATIYSEWHDDRLTPWVHYVPMDNTYQDLFGIMNYFLDGHDVAAQRIAIEGMTWASQVLRQDDMLLYVWRVLLEWARICNDDRELLGFVDDLKE